MAATGLRRALCNGSFVAALAVALLSGCAQRDSITVGAVPDDYRTNHPIFIGQQDEVLDLPVGAGDRGMTEQQREALEGFLANYDPGAAPVLSIIVPSGSANHAAASHTAKGFARVAVANGVPKSRIAIRSYQASSAETSAPIRVTFTSMRAQTGKCGRWPEDILQNSAENKHYANFGCSYQNNLAAQVSNPADLLGPRKQSPIDAERRDVVINRYRVAPSWVEPPQREVFF
ncbi:MAG: CpaD family pilus assembly protein [Rhizobium sp.]|jgi:pilus assembly protein CpaD